MQTTDALLSRYQRIRTLLPMATQIKLAPLIQRIRLSPHFLDQKAVERDISRLFPRASPQQALILQFYALGKAVLDDDKNSLPAVQNQTDISTTQQMQIQKLMNERSQITEALSNMLKDMQQTQESIVQNIKS